MAYAGRLKQIVRSCPSRSHDFLMCARGLNVSDQLRRSPCGESQAERDFLLKQGEKSASRPLHHTV